MNIKENEQLQGCLEKVKEKNRRDAENGRIRYVYIQTFGCQQNEADGEKLRGMAEAMGYRYTSDAEQADLILLNTCAVREHAELKALSIIGNCKRLREKNPELIVGVCGCMTARQQRVDQLKKGYPYVTFTLEPASLHLLPLVLCRVMEEKRRRFLLGEDDGEAAEGVPVARTHKHRAYVSIMYGCNNFCTYCIVPYVRGRERSRESELVVAEVKELVEDGCRDITLLGQNVNSYKSDCDFAGLLEKLCALPGDFLLRFMTSHPKDVSDRLIEVMAKHPHRMAPHFHLPLQSGSDRILAAMNRRYTTEHYLGIVDRLRAAMPHVTLTSDIIVGFPGETEEDFAATLDMLRRVRFDMVYSFLYSPRSGTPAAEREEDFVPDDVKGERFSRLLALQDEIALEANRRYEGETLRVLTDSISRGDSHMYSGRTAAGKLVHFPATQDAIGQFVFVKIERADPYALHGAIVDA
ncbi:MAG: tRNA (N6-isopentenyl adenosine(37)-C2)-methylthiotransferase MiaB [Clostridia bacterium]|nr:tRNA (N6-isopentenyl adenosine(37)-C2)-methylthiotransferase MiaB [Clostridia bacterium]